MPAIRSHMANQSLCRANTFDHKELFRASASHAFRGSTGLDHTGQLRSFLKNTFPYLHGYDGEKVEVDTFRKWIQRYERGEFDTILSLYRLTRITRSDWKSVELEVRDRLIQDIRSLAIEDIIYLSVQQILVMLKAVQDQVYVLCYTQTSGWAYGCRREALGEETVMNRLFW